MWRYQVVVLLIAAVPMAAHGESGSDSYNSCRSCHTDIFELWKHSLHAQSFTDPPFQAAYVKMMLDMGSDSTRLCLRCHAPKAYLMNDFDPKSPAAAEGVSCSFCHAIASVNEDNLADYFNIDSAEVAYGPYPSKDPTGHAVQYSELHLSSRLCVGCHEYTNPNGVALLETYSEWKASPYPADDINCQNCHMPIMYDLRVVNDRHASDYFVTAHEFRGGHSEINLAHAVKLETRAARTGSNVQVEVVVTNAESGHKLPTGIPVRKLILDVVMKSRQGSVIASGRRVYRKVLCDKFGTVIENVPDMFVKATHIYADNRIAPKESRTEHFTFEIPMWASSYTIETVLNYEYSRPVLTEESVNIEMAKSLIDSKGIK